jgi:hypothetical protein
MPSNPLWLDLGSGPEPAPGFTGVDFGCEATPGSDAEIVHCDLFNGFRWPWEDESIEKVRAWHVIEHIPHDRIPREMRMAKIRRLTRTPSGESIVTNHEEPYRITQDAFFWFFDEAFRIAKPGCTFELAWPHPWHEHADQDPTHHRRIPLATIFYLSREGRRTMRVHHYPVSCDWHVVDGSAMCLGSDDDLRPYPNAEMARRHVGAFHEIRVTLIKPTKEISP